MAAAAGALLPGDGIVIAGKLYSGVALTLDTCLLPHESAHCSPSRAHGLSARTEQQLRNRMCEMIQSAGILLRLPQVAMATAQILFHRFFYCKSFVRHCAETVAMACLQLASKIEEEPRRVRDVLNVFQHLKDAAGDRRRGPMLLDDGYVSRKSNVIKAERRVLKELGFCVHVKHPHKVIVMYLQVVECEKNTRLLQMAWNYMNDSLRTDVFLRFRAETIACACIFLSARVLQIPLPDQPPWFLLFGASEQDLIEISCCILRLYTLQCESLAALLQQVEEMRSILDAQYNTSKQAGLVSTTETPTAGFSPASKAGGFPSKVANLIYAQNWNTQVSPHLSRAHLSQSSRRSLTCLCFRRSRSVSSPSPGRTKSHRHRQRERERARKKPYSSNRR
uniref:Cyclin-like domain-containing protein n=1 Tax=Sinocyclocheilus anshuiensis TaxID=1608454 RepID=A0A671QJN9_9TELE